MPSKDKRAVPVTNSVRTLRQRAEASLRELPDDFDAISPADLRQMYHDLRVHQIELEMQNEELRSSQLALDTAQARYFDFYDLAPVGYLSVNARGLIEHANLTTATLLGVARGALIQQPISRFILKADQEIFYRYRQQLIETQQAQGCELRLQKADGTPFWGQLDAIAVPDDASVAPALRIVLRDITQYKQMDLALQDSEFRWKFAVEGSGDGLWDWNVEDSTVFFSTTWKEMLGYADDEIGSSLVEWETRIHPEEKANTLAAVRDTLADNTPLYLSEHRVLCKDGRYKWILDRGVVVSRGHNGHPLRMIGTHTDITERKLVEQELRQSEQRFRSLISHNNAIILQVEPSSGKILDTNAAAEKFYGWTHAEMCAKSIQEINVLPPAEIAVELAAASRAQRNTFIFKHRLASGEIRIVEVHSTPIFDGSRSVLVSIIHDITERKRAEEQLREMAAELENKVIERTTQLHKMSAQLTLTEERERRQLAESLHDNLGQLLALIKIRLASHETVVPQADFNSIMALVGQAEQAVRQITQQLSPSILQMLSFVPALEWLVDNLERQYGLSVHIHNKSGSRPLVEEIQAMLFRAVRELLINVAKHAKVDSATLAVLCDGKQLRLVVSDAGCGFSTDRLDGGLLGYGKFGLNSIHERMSTIGGQMKIDSRPGHGATITLTLPCAIATQESAP